jgi:hypothetical protein
MNQHRIAHHTIYEISIKYLHLYSSVVFGGSSSKGERIWFSDATPDGQLVGGRLLPASYLLLAARQAVASSVPDAGCRLARLLCPADAPTPVKPSSCPAPPPAGAALARRHQTAHAVARIARRRTSQEPTVWDAAIWAGLNSRRPRWSKGYDPGKGFEPRSRRKLFLFLWSSSTC